MTLEYSVNRNLELKHQI